MSLPCALLTSLVLSTVTIPTGASVAVMPLQPRQGVSKDTADMLSTHLLAAVKERGRFKKVVGMGELETLLSFDQTKSLMGCDDASCTAEVAGALGVDLILSGSVGRLGDSWLFSASLLDARAATSLSTVSLSVQGTSETALAAAVPGLVAQLLGEPPAALNVSSGTQARPEVSPAGDRPVWSKAVMAAGGVGLVAGGVTVLLGVLGASVAGLVYAAWWAMPDAVDGRVMRTGALATVGGGSVLGVAGLALGVVVAAVGVVALAAGLLGGAP